MRQNNFFDWYAELSRLNEEYKESLNELKKNELSKLNKKFPGKYVICYYNDRLSKFVAAEAFNTKEEAIKEIPMLKKLFKKPGSKNDLPDYLIKLISPDGRVI